mgnify:CR=1 FL=1
MHVGPERRAPDRVHHDTDRHSVADGQHAASADRDLHGPAVRLPPPALPPSHRAVLQRADLRLADHVPDGGLQTVSLTLPAIVTTDLRLNEPRYASLPNIMKAKKKPLDTLTADELGVDISPRVTLVKVSPPPQRQAGIKVESVDELVDKLKNEAKVI